MVKKIIKEVKQQKTKFKDIKKLIKHGQTLIK